ncbi:hypothetical protein NUW54_g10796 [Trametes sanguinea]|uniref:Uncharacterized protein n=1 Tax=Trametes sanguinea TaxID=158606 RepID=A0ACC1NSH3_9APHY|nr:hypothetical protein NUW54_g10796 [Trametes sanguinea]
MVAMSRGDWEMRLSSNAQTHPRAIHSCTTTVHRSDILHRLVPNSCPITRHPSSSRTQQSVLCRPTPDISANPRHALYTHQRRGSPRLAPAFPRLPSVSTQPELVVATTTETARSDGYRRRIVFLYLHAHLHAHARYGNSGTADRSQLRSPPPTPGGTPPPQSVAASLFSIHPATTPSVPVSIVCVNRLVYQQRSATLA